MNKHRKIIFPLMLFGHFLLIHSFGQNIDTVFSGKESLSYILQAQQHHNNDQEEEVKATFEEFMTQLDKHPKKHPVDDWVDSCYTFSYSVFRSGNYKLLIELLRPIFSIEPIIEEDIYYEQIGRLFNLLAIAYKREGLTRESIYINLKILEYFKQCESLTSGKLTGQYINLGNAYKGIGDMGEVDTYFNEALRLIDKQLAIASLPLKEREFFSAQKSTVFSSIGLSFQKLGKHDEALLALQTSMDLAKEWDTTKLPRINNNIGVSYLAKKDTLKALSHFEQSIAVYTTKELDYSWVHYTLNYSDFLMKLDSVKIKKASELINRVILEGPMIAGVSEAQLATAYFQLGTIQIEKGLYEDAIKNIDWGLSLITGKETHPDFSTNLPEIVLDNSPNQVIEGIKFRARAFLDWANNSNDSSKYYISLENYHLAETCIDSLRDIYVEEESKNNLSRIAKETYSEKLDVLWNVLPSSNYNEIANKALESIENGKAAGLWNIIQTSENKNLSLPPEIVKQENQLRREIADYANRIYENELAGGQGQDSLEDAKFLKETALDNLTRSINETYSDLSNENNHGEFTPLHEIRALLSDSEVMIHYFFSETMLHQVFVSSDSIIFKAIPNANELRDQILEFSSMLRLSKYDYSSTDVKNYQELGWILYSKLIHPFDDLIKNKKVIILPDEYLALIPFEALITREPFQSESDFRKLAYFIRNNQISYSYNASLWAYRKETLEPAPKSVLAIAPSYEIDKIESDTIWKNWKLLLPELQGTLKEVELIKDKYLAETYIKAKATEKKFKEKASDFNILHLAMHSIMDETNPDNSFLAFTPLADNSENGRLYANEIRNLDLNSSLTILSACNSGKGEIIEGEGVLSLSRTFILAGSSSVIMTLWSVDDQTSMELIERLYNDMALDMSVAEALRSAKLFYIDNANKLYAHPYFWSGFIQLGRDISIEIENKTNRWPWFSGGAILIAFVLLLIRPRNTKPRSKE